MGNFKESIKASSETMERLNAVSREYKRQR